MVYELSLKRFFTSFLPPCNTTFALLIKAILSHNSSTDSIRWVEKMMVVPRCFNSKISSFSKFALIGSKPEKGSSKMISLGSWTIVAMNWVFCCIPFERSSTFLSHQSLMSNLINQRFNFSRASAFFMPFNWARYKSCSPTFIFL